MPSRNICDALRVKTTLLRTKKIPTGVCNAVTVLLIIYRSDAMRSQYFRLFINLMHILPPVTAKAPIT